MTRTPDEVCAGLLKALMNAGIIEVCQVEMGHPDVVDALEAGFIDTGVHADDHGVSQLFIRKIDY